MRILIDIVHMADINFFRNAINILREEGHEVVLTVMDRGNLPGVVEHDLGKAKIIGRHAKGGLPKKALANIERVRALRSYIREIKPDVVTSFSYYPAAAVRGLDIPNIVFHDDPEYRMQWRLCNLFAQKLIIPDAIDETSTAIKKYHGYKEWSYLDPHYFSPDKSVLAKYSLKPDSYVLIREVGSISLNYRHVSGILTPQLHKKLNQLKLKAVISRERKDQPTQPHTILLKEPLDDVHSLIYYARCVISNGDTMIREAALLGVPAIHTGDRRMAVNAPLEAIGAISYLHDEEVIDYLNSLTPQAKEHIRDKLAIHVRSLDDIPQLITHHLTSIVRTEAAV